MKHLIVTMLCMGLFTACKSQTATPQVYTNMAISGEELYALTPSGKVDIYNTVKHAFTTIDLRTDKPITQLTVDKKNNLVIVDSVNHVERFNSKKQTFETIFNGKETIYNICFDNNNQLYVIDKQGIISLIDNKTYYPDDSLKLNRQIGGWFKPSAVLVDSNNRLWIGSEHGEWGGELFVFDIKSKKFIKPQTNGFELDLNPVKSIFTDGHLVYLSSGLAHLSLTDGSLVQFNNLTAKVLFKSKLKYIDTTLVINGKPRPAKMTQAGEYIGPACFNPKDGCLYFYCQNGVFKGEPKQNLEKIENWTKLFKPLLHWRNGGQADATGPAMNVLKMEFAPDGRLYLLTQNDGIGVYDGAKFSRLVVN
ncbi:hypothetical protein C8P68_10117 [Mucilaginibacter yixingensis]|uniref:Uncharacterized protein n=1 Tax=Mucilaginibacter yixingensis TaxID=1295612 RepID=A0A2T5JEC8_9SPHI|nr:hypothetical protein [Mucilaginibacter yixingensis]PTR00790.1 hypothetical protein C8P68_10117 [Mucilaginibacter yixingensis]